MRATNVPALSKAYAQGYQREVPLQVRYKLLSLHGRADSVAVLSHRLKEIKNFRHERVRRSKTFCHLH